MTLFIIISCLFVIDLVLLFLCSYNDWGSGWFDAILSLLIVFWLGMIISAGFVSKKVKPVEYPVSEYDFMIKIVEFEEQRDTILVVIPKEE